MNERQAIAPTMIAGRSVLFAMAAEPEYGPHLQRRFVPLFTGVGPVEAAVELTAALAGLEADGTAIDLVVSLGSAGSATLEQTKVYQAISIGYRDMDATPLGFARGVTPFLDEPAEIVLPLYVPGIPTARLSSGGDIVSGDAYMAIDADMVDMETYAVWRACRRFTVPMIGLRGISDGARALTHVNDWREYLHIVDENLAAAVDALASAIEDGTLLP
ncbi:5'-methylthioadenosine/S-adenosylhomocysteine nucleosidase [Pararhizobium mangrovi]|uniref:5'-methylthioadenosine/S-adenosylhomocysteine nucleosidase n=1 Tax=Pararhizobium mangrovi TaxID=2590452 RepID=A0A506U5X6_9HYPH|nr:5'-methylthioadenosine/S-adenosylhomocysteine nucleosidase [Pararhizobium mangrovi]TPW28375.1 5'-methylthioadenosine/S-adenosylhomocysteine nucleosidase [Pararhizobium mangrovi]